MTEEKRQPGGSPKENEPGGKPGKARGPIRKRRPPPPVHAPAQQGPEPDPLEPLQQGPEEDPLGGGRKGGKRPL